MKFVRNTGVLAVCLLMSTSAMAVEAVRRVPELDGGYALLALGLVVTIVAVIKERRRS